MTIDELAGRAGVSFRTVRLYRDKGLLPPPRVVGRTGSYDDGHLARLTLIGRLLARRFSLASIKALVAAWEDGRSLGDVLGLEEALLVPNNPSRPARITIDQLEARFGSRLTPDVIDLATRLGIIERTGDDWLVHWADLFEAGATLVRAGYPLAALLEEAVRVVADVERIADRFLTLFLTFVWAPFEDAGRPSDGVTRVTEIMRITRPVPARVAAAAMNRAMRLRIEELLPSLLGADATEGESPRA